MIRFGTLGAARITPGALIYPCMNEPRALVTAMAARDRKRAESFAEAHHISRIYDRYEEVIALDDIQAIYNPLPISAHCEWTLKALDAGKHVLCEKSFASNALEAALMHQRALDSGLVLMDAFHYRYHPVFIRAKEIFDSSQLGVISSIDAVFCVPVKGATDIRMNYDTGGGVTMDIGCYPISWVRHLSGKEPVDVEASAVVGPPDVDLSLDARMIFDDGLVATVHGDMRESASMTARITVIGDRGEMVVENPIAPQLGHLITLTVDGETSYETRDRRPSYCYQLDAFIDAIENNAPMYTDSADAVKQMALIDRCYLAAGLPIRGAPCE